MGLCCLFNKQKRYAYQVGRFGRDYSVERVLVTCCMKCRRRKIKTYMIGDREYEKFLCHTDEEVVRLARVNGMPFLSEVSFEESSDLTTRKS